MELSAEPGPDKCPQRSPSSRATHEQALKNGQDILPFAFASRLGNELSRDTGVAEKSRKLTHRVGLTQSPGDLLQRVTGDNAAVVLLGIRQRSDDHPAACPVAPRDGKSHVTDLLEPLMGVIPRIGDPWSVTPVVEVGEASLSR